MLGVVVTTGMVVLVVLAWFGIDSSQKARKQRCTNGGKQHKFEAVHEERQVGGRMKVPKYHFERHEDLRRMFFFQVYVGHVCKWCGKVVKFGGAAKKEQEKYSDGE